MSSDLVATIESDVALVTRILRQANRQEGPSHRHVENIVDALNILSPDDLRQALNEMETFDFFERGGIWHSAPVRFRLHALATQQAAERLARMIGYRYRDRLLVTSLLHDIGKLALMHAYPGYPRQVHGTARTPEERLEAERELLGVDHALVGGVLARRWGLPNVVAKAIERHHNDSQHDDAPLVRLADMLAHYAYGAPVSHAKMVDVAREIGLSPVELRQLMFELPYAPEERHRTLDPCPLSSREVEVLRRLGEGKVYKQIAKGS
jgi:putative nucleotidyltransferase with HDIG domain